MTPPGDNLSVMIIAGELSGDQRGAELVQAIRKEHPEYSFFGIGGKLMREAGVITFYDVEDMAVMGLSEVLNRLRFFRRVFKAMLREAETRNPAAVILVDYPGFNLRFAARAHAMGLKVIYFICPQVWAWNRGRIPRMAKNIDRLISIFPFEAEHFLSTGLKVDFVGHPLVEEAARIHKKKKREALPWQGEPRIALLPGSRRHEVERMLPIMLDAAVTMTGSTRRASFIIAAPSPEMRNCIERLVSDHESSPFSNITIVTGNTREVLKQATAAVVTSGTATIEASLMRCPMIIVYRMAALTYLIGRILVRVDHIGMVNLIADARLCPELVQHDANGDNIAKELGPILGAVEARERMIAGLDRVNEKLGKGGAADNAATSVISVLQS